VLAAIGAHRLGGPLAEQLILTGATINAAAAEKAGLVAAVLAGENSEEECLEWYRKNLRQLSAFSIRQATRVARIGSGLIEALEGPLDRIERQYVDEVLAGHDGNEGITSFIERRKPTWKDS
jgi:enoyl-CoA hydratase